jgi:RHS repeat-associated protein
MKSNIIFCFSLFILPLLSGGQPNTVILNSQETGTQNHDARQSIEFQNGYNYVPGSGIMTASIVDGVTGQVSYNTTIEDPTSRSILTSYLVGTTEGSFNVSPLGSATYTIPIELPEGVNGLKPDLSLAYSSMAGPGIAGYGWQIAGISAITRAPQTIFQDGQAKAVGITYDDRFALDGQRLVCTSGTYGYNYSQYRTAEDIFARVTANGWLSCGPAGFTAETKSGHIVKYGSVYGENFTDKSVQQISSSGLSWFVSSVSDLFGNKINYYYLNNGGNVYPSTIEYGPNQVIFYYKERTDITYSYFLGSTFSQDLLLDKIEIIYNGNLLKTYQLKYNKLSNDYYDRSALNEVIEYGTGGSRFNSTAFKYEQPGNIFHQSPASYTNSVISKNSTIYSADYNGDGKEELFAVSYANRRDWWLYTDSNWSWFTSSSSGTSTFDIDWAVPTDVNGDGKVDLILMDQGASSCTYYYRLSTGTSFSDPVFIATVSTTFGYFDPKYKYSADFDGDGMNDFLGKVKYGGVNHWNLYSMFHGTTLYSSMPLVFDGTIDSWGDMDYVGDFNGDGKADIWIVNSSGLKIYTINGNSLTTLYSGSVISSSSQFKLGDFNGDGKMDIFIYGTTASDWTTWQIQLATGNSFQNHSFAAKKTNLRYDNVFTGDFNGDGRSDILALSQNSGNNPRQYYFVSNLNGDNFYSENVEQNDLDQTYSYLIGEYDGNGRFDIIVMSGTTGYKIANKSCNTDMLMTAIGDGLGNVTQINYNKLSEAGTNYTKDETGDNFPVLTYQGPLNVVRTVTRNSDESHLYEYVGLKLHRFGKGLLCFSKITDNEYISGNVVENQYSYHTGTSTSWYYTKLISTTKRHGSNNMSVITNEYSQIEFNTSAGTKRVFPYISSTSEENVLTGQTVTSSFGYDNYGNVTSYEKDYGCRTETTTNTITNIDNSSTWLLGRVTNSSTTFSASGSSSITKQVNRTYLSTSNLIETETFYPSTTSELVKSYEYYSSGNLKKETRTGETDRITQYEYESDNVRVSKITDPLGHETNKAYNTYGLLESETDWLNNSVSFTYDNLFRPNVQTNADGSTVTTTLNWANGGGPSGACYYRQKEGNDGAVSKTWFDKEGREVRKDVKGFNSNMVAVLKTYNTKGELASVSEPYYDSGSPSQSTTYTYDDYGRPSGISRFTGSSTSYSYSSNTVTETTNSDTYTKTYNADGTLAEATDPGGTLTYAYYPDGKSYTISKGSNTITTLSYDIAGNKTQMVDNSAGTISYTYTKFGELKSQTTARNYTTTLNYYSDGRLDTKVTQEGTTTYSYNSNKQLTGISSPGSISRSQTYDSKGRIQTITETIDGSNYQTSFAYDAIGRLDTRTHPSGIVEKNSYNSSGYLYQTLADNAVVWAINTMDERQNIRTASYGNGTLSATFGFDSYGLPNSSVVTGIQNYSYSFDPVRGNLTWRKNENNGIQENFNYDNLDRLTTTYRGQTLYHQTSYESDGRITAKTDFGASYTYDTQNKPNAVSDISDSPVDLPDDQTLSFTSFEKVSSISEGLYSAEFLYNADYDRAKMTVANGTTFLTRRYAGSRYMKETLSGTDKEYTYLGGDAYSAPVVAVKSGGNTVYYYLIRDYLGSITHVYNASTQTTQEYSYDAWGRRRNASNWSYDLTGQPELFAGRGFTSHEHLTWFNLINMNGRLYDPLVGAFVSPDPSIQTPDNTQGFNRYSYCLNNPLLYVDPSGYSFLSNFGNWIAKNWKPIVTIAAQVAVGIAVAAIVVASAGTLAPLAVGIIAGAAAGAAGGFVGGVLGTALNGGNLGQCLAAGGMQALWGAAAGAVGGFASTFAPPGAIMGALYGAGSGGMIGGLSSQMSGGSFWDGAKMGMVFGGIGGGISGYLRAAKTPGLNRWTGKPTTVPPKTTSIYRAVSSKEYNDISENGLRPNPDGTGYQEGKLFYKSYEDAVKNTAAYDARFGQESTIIEIKVPNSSSQYFTNFEMDGFNVIYIKAQDLPAINNVMTFKKY